MPIASSQTSRAQSFVTEANFNKYFIYYHFSLIVDEITWILLFTDGLVTLSSYKYQYFNLLKKNVITCAVL